MVKDCQHGKYIWGGGDSGGGRNVLSMVLKGCRVQKHVMMQVKLEWRQYLEKSTYCYHYGVKIHHSLLVQWILLMLDSNHQGRGEKKDAEDPGNEDSEVTNNVVAENIVYGCADDPNMPELEEIARFSDAKDDILGADMNNLDTYFQANPIPTTEYTKTYHNETN
ncbi:hypothetical protein Tco_1203745 [Tanacetum coccineum]